MNGGRTLSPHAVTSIIKKSKVLTLVHTWHLAESVQPGYRPCLLGTECSLWLHPDLD